MGAVKNSLYSQLVGREELFERVRSSAVGSHRQLVTDSQLNPEFGEGSPHVLDKFLGGIN